jgi:DcuC family C4-dicarboxylate transporter
MNAVTILVAIAVIVGGAILIGRRVDVRLVLLLAAAPLFAVAGQFPAMILAMAREMANHRTIVPICSAVGFAYVLNITECDQHLVHVLLKPLRKLRVLLIPGGVAAGYVVNSAIVSQTGAAAVIGPILVPLLLAAGFSAEAAGATLLLGCSMGGELFNPGAVEVVTLAGLTHLEAPALVPRMRWVNLTACAAALLAFWLVTARRERASRAPVSGSREAVAERAHQPEGFRVNGAKAIVPLIPLALLYLFPKFSPFPEEPQDRPAAGAKALAEQRGSATILAAMLVGVVAAGATSPRQARKLAPAFFEGAGYAYTHVISLIVVATTFAEGMEASGLIKAMKVGLARLGPAPALLLSIAAPWGMAFVCGSGIAPAVAVMNSLVPVADALHIDPIRLGTVIALAAHFGRTMSPVAAVVFMSTTLTKTAANAVITRVFPALLIGGVVLFLAAFLKPR